MQDSNSQFGLAPANGVLTVQQFENWCDSVSCNAQCPSRGIFGGGQSAGIGSIIGAQVGWGTNAFQSRQQITFSSR